MYIGRFAPSPSGPLHMGSLVAALASYLDAKAHNGLWHLRIEDLDTPRCDPKYSSQIQSTLSHHGLCWDGSVLLQSDRLLVYHRHIEEIISKSYGYYCQCTRKIIKDNAGVHPASCKLNRHNSGAVRFHHLSQTPIFTDRFKGNVSIDDSHIVDDFVLLRKDGIVAYNLAVVVDDISQHINHIVRGEDLLTTTPSHLALYKFFNQPVPSYAHFPVLKDHNGLKLSKQNHAPAICDQTPEHNLKLACQFLEIDIQSGQNSINGILSNAIHSWRLKHGLVEG